MKLRQLALALSLVGASSVGLVGCGGSSNDYDELEYPVKVVGAYMDECVVTDASRTATQEDLGVYIFSIEPTGPITAASCVNPVTGSTVPDLKTPSGKTVITPVTTMVANGASEAQVRAAFGGLGAADLFADPIVVASNGDTSLLKASVKISSLIEAAVAAGSSGTDAVTGLTNSVASATDTATFATAVTNNVGLSAGAISAINAIVDAQNNIAYLEGAIKAVKDDAAAINALVTEADGETYADTATVEPATGDAVTPVDGGTVDDGTASSGSGGSGGSGAN